MDYANLIFIAYEFTHAWLHCVNLCTKIDSRSETLPTNEKPSPGRVAASRDPTLLILNIIHRRKHHSVVGSHQGATLRTPHYRYINRATDAK